MHRSYTYVQDSGLGSLHRQDTLTQVLRKRMVIHRDEASRHVIVVLRQYYVLLCQYNYSSSRLVI